MTAPGPVGSMGAMWTWALLCAALATPQQQRPSLEAFLERARLERSELHAELQYAVDDVLEQLESVEARESSGLTGKLRARLRDLGPECTPLLVPALEPGESPETGARFRSEQVAEALARMNTRAVTGELLALLAGGSAEGRRNAAIVLANSPEHDRASAALGQAFQDSPRRVQEACLRALARLGGRKNFERIAEVLRVGDVELEAMALRALALAPTAGSLQLVRNLGDAGGRHAKEILAFYEAARDHVQEDDLAALIRLAGDSRLTTLLRTQILEAVAGFPVVPSSDHRDLLEPLADHPDRDLREAARVALVLSGDRSEKRRLIKDADDIVDKSPNWAKAWSRRGDVYYRIRDFGKAVSDYKKALQLGRDDPQPLTDVHIQLARSYAQAGKLREAREALRDASLTRKRLLELADDPAFAELRGSRYGDVFE